MKNAKTIVTVERERESERAIILNKEEAFINHKREGPIIYGRLIYLRI